MNDELKRFKKDIGKKIKFLRKRSGMTQKDLAHKLDKDFQAVSRMENGNVNPSSFIVKKIADVLDINVSEIFSPLEEQKH